MVGRTVDLVDQGRTLVTALTTVAVAADAILLEQDLTLDSFPFESGRRQMHRETALFGIRDFAGTQ
jgi:hypothetical protein